MASPHIAPAFYCGGPMARPDWRSLGRNAQRTVKYACALLCRKYQPCRTLEPPRDERWCNMRAGLALGRGILTALLVVVAPLVYADEPIDLLRRSVERSINVLEDPRYDTEKIAQRDKLCEIVQEIFDPLIFARLALATEWTRFSDLEKDEFEDVFLTFLCRHYLTMLQDRYAGEQINFTRQTFKSDTRVSIEADVIWHGVEVPVEVRMVLRQGQWIAYDLVIAGVSTVMLYRVQFQTVLRESTPAQLIEDIRKKKEGAG